MYQSRNLTTRERLDLVRNRVARGCPSHAPPHVVPDKQTYLLTASCYEHRKHLGTNERRLLLLDLLSKHCAERAVQVHAWVVLPNHYHLLIGVADFGVVGDIIRRAHGATARRWNLEDEQLGRKVWYRFSDRAIRSEAHYFAVLNYLHYNPVKHGWAQSPYDWAESSVHWYVEHLGREWLRDSWTRFPVRDFGTGWDDAGRGFPAD